MTTITINDCVYNVHPIYNLYATSKDGNVINIIKRVPYQGNKKNNGYMNVMVRKHGQSGQKGYYIHQFVWECFNGEIPEGKVVNHINNNKQDNRLCNLQLVTTQQNCKKSTTISDCVYNVHPIYNLYAASKDGNVINIVKRVPHKGNKCHNGYMNVTARKHGQSGFKTYQVHRFVWECFNGVIPEGKVIDHINNNKEDNRLCNLQLVTHQQNCKKSAKDRDYTFAAKNCANKKCVKAINCNTNEVTYFNSMYAINQHLGINAGIVKMVCEGLNNNKSGISKKDGNRYKFEYIKPDELPADYKKSANIRPKRVSADEKKKYQKEALKKWQNKEYKCLKCGISYKNSYKYSHKKRCNK